MKNKLSKEIIIAGIILILGTCLRLYQFTARTPFDWDQTRDYEAVQKIAAGKFTLLGPVVGGEGGFYLGPLYYYLLVPGYTLLGGSPLALPLTSISIDVLTIALSIYLLRSRLGKAQALIVASLWSLSWFAIEWSHVSWNVALAPAWSLALYCGLFDAIKGKKAQGLIVLGALAGLAWHIHASLIPLVPVILLCCLKTLRYSWKIWALAAIAGLVTMMPLIVFDLRHDWLNTNLITKMITGEGEPKSSWDFAVQDVPFKLSKSMGGLLTGTFKPLPGLGYLLIAAVGWAVWQKNKTYKIAAAMIAPIVIAAIWLRDSGLPEYYFVGTYIPFLILLACILVKLWVSKWRPFIAILAVAWLASNLFHYQFKIVPYSLGEKMLLINKIKSLDVPVEVHFDISPGRDGGLRALLQTEKVQLDQSAKTKIMITDHLEKPTHIDEVVAEEIYHTYAFRLARLIK